MKKRINLLVIITVIVISCQTQKKSKHFNREGSIAESIFSCDELGKLGTKTLNDKAIELLLKSDSLYYDRNLKTATLKEALNYLDCAIDLDSSYHLAYYNKSSIYIELGEYKDAIKTLERLRKREFLPEANFLLGVLYEITDSLKKAHRKYSENYIFYKKEFDSSLNVDDKLNMYFTLIFLKTKEEALDSLNYEIEVI